MTKIEQLANEAKSLSEEQLDALIDYVRYFSSEPVYRTASQEVLSSIQRGLEQHPAGDTVPAEQVFADLQRKIDAAKK